MNKNNNTRIIAISGSLRKGSYTTQALKIALQGAAEFTSNLKLINLRDYDLIFCDGESDESNYPKDVLTLREEIKEAQGIILGTPEYHGSISGVLKNTLDLMGFNEFEGKMIGLIGVSGGTLGAIGALSSLRNIGRSLHAWVIPEQVAISNGWEVFSKDGEILDKTLEKRLKKVGYQVARFAWMHNEEKFEEFLKDWEHLPYNPGAEKR